MGKVKKRYDNIFKSKEDKREYRGLILENDMKVVLISDSTTDKSAASLDVNIGMNRVYTFIYSFIYKRTCPFTEYSK